MAIKSYGTLSRGGNLSAERYSSVWEDGWMHSQLGFCYDRQRRIKEGMEELLTALELDLMKHGFMERLDGASKRLMNMSRL